MGIFKYLGDTLSGKIEKNNILIGRNVNRFVNYVSPPDEPNFVRNWVLACVLDIQTTLEMILPIGRDINTVKGVEYFSENLAIFNEQKIFQIFKLLSGCHLFLFLKKENNCDFLKEIGLDKKSFENKIFNIFEFTKNDQLLYLDFSKIADNDIVNYPLNLWNEAMKVCFEGKYKPNNKILFILCPMTIDNYNKVFYPTLVDIIQNDTGIMRKITESPLFIIEETIDIVIKHYLKLKVEMPELTDKEIYGQIIQFRYSIIPLKENWRYGKMMSEIENILELKSLVFKILVNESPELLLSGNENMAMILEIIEKRLEKYNLK
jgi:hypothetical protein